MLCHNLNVKTSHKIYPGVLFLLMVLFVSFTGARAQETPPAVPVKGVEKQTLGEGPVVLELFSSQACAFCPDADQLLGDLIGNANVIGLACHVDYFDVREGSLAQSFCTDRQTLYESYLRSGPNYTPQLVINGAHDVVGYRLEQVTEIIEEAKRTPPQRIEVVKTGGKRAYEIALPDLKAEEALQIYVMTLDKPHEVKITEGANSGQTITYHNIASHIQTLEPWDGVAKKLAIEVEVKPRHHGFVVLVQDSGAGHIQAAGQYRRN